ncbi:PTS sugar transporter subunit IIA [Bacillus kwashiorkori]|uniref:PTS sugar transporter subunit IIA n=1 Tax=Bacillus kwashiorkori TaxID=1522318 RepID=UPI0007816949|nr:PTS sugar transporter subunit IIA [Bacillus kwashiorkori]
MLISEDQIYLNASYKYRDEVLKFISSEAEKIDAAQDKEIVFQDFVQRENEYSTAFQEGIAIPHAKSKAVKEAKLFFVRLQNSIDWNSPNNFKVKVVFAILVPEAESGTKHIQILSNLAGNLLEEEFQEQVFNAKDKQSILELLKTME